MYKIQLIGGGPRDGEILDVEVLRNNVTFERPEPVSWKSVGERLKAGDRIPVSELEGAGEVHTYARTFTLRNGRHLYKYVPTRTLEEELQPDTEPLPPEPPDFSGGQSEAYDPSTVVVVSSPFDRPTTQAELDAIRERLLGELRDKIIERGWVPAECEVRFSIRDAAEFSQVVLVLEAAESEAD